MKNENLVDVALVAGAVAALGLALTPWAVSKYKDTKPHYSVDGKPGIPEWAFDPELRQQLRQLAVGEVFRQFDAARGKSYDITRVK